MNRIIDISQDNMTVCCEAGVITEELQTKLIDKGLYFPTDPTSGDYHKLVVILPQMPVAPSGKYGVVRDYVLNRVVLADGSIIWTGSNTRKNASGYSLTHLMIGSEGTLGVITKVQLKLIPFPSHRLLMAALFENSEQASQTVYQLFKLGIQPSCIELIDQNAYTLSCQYLNMDNPAPYDQLLIEIDGKNEALLWQQCEAIHTLLQTKTNYDVQVADSAASQSETMAYPPNISPAIKQFKQVLKAMLSYQEIK